MICGRERRMVERRIKAAKFEATRSPPLMVCKQTFARCQAGLACMPEEGATDSFDCKAIPRLNQMQVLELGHGGWTLRCYGVIMPEACLLHDALGPSGTGKTHIALGLALTACRKGQVGQLPHRRRVRHRARTDGAPMAHAKCWWRPAMSVG